jgi:hypothetical protein
MMGAPTFPAKGLRGTLAKAPNRHDILEALSQSLVRKKPED